MNVCHMRGRYDPTEFSRVIAWAVVTGVGEHPTCMIDVRAVPTNKALAPYWKVLKF
jgi:hypothetical protein